MRRTRGRGSTTDAGANPITAMEPARAYPFLPVEGEDLHQIPVGPVHAGIIEPGHFRFTASGETVVRLEQRFGYVHKGIDVADDAAPRSNAPRASPATFRATARSPTAWPLRARWKRRSGVTPPPRAVYLRALMAELERIANHLGDFGAICNDASFVLIHAHCGVLRERTLRAASAAFGHRLMMDCIAPGGVDGRHSRRRSSSRARGHRRAPPRPAGAHGNL